VSYVEVEYEMSERHACRLLGLGRSTNRDRMRKAERDAALRLRLKELRREAHAVRLPTADGDADAGRNGGESQARVAFLSGGRIGHADSPPTPDALARAGYESGGEPAE